MLDTPDEWSIPLLKGRVHVGAGAERASLGQPGLDGMPRWPGPGVVARLRRNEGEWVALHYLPPQSLNLRTDHCPHARSKRRIKVDDIDTMCPSTYLSIPGLSTSPPTPQELVSAGDSPVECIQACARRVVSVNWQGEVCCVINPSANEKLDALLYGPDRSPDRERTTFR